MLLGNEIGQKALQNIELGKECAMHASIFFFDKDCQQNLAAEGHFSIYPSDQMIPGLRRDYDQMSAMIFGDTPSFDAILSSLESASKELTLRCSEVLLKNK
jgi:hypothetical protein